MLLKFIENIGDKTINSVVALYNFLSFSIISIGFIFNPRSYNPQMRISLITQIYHTSVTIIPHFIMMAFLFGSIIIGLVIVMATKFSLEGHIGSIIINFVIDEFAPFFTALFISLRSGTLINKKLASIDFDKESNIINNIVLPPIISGIVSTFALSSLFAMLIVSSGYIFIFFFIGMDLHTYKHLLLDEIEFHNILVLSLKSIIFGFFTMAIPIYNGIKIAKDKENTQVSILNSIIKLFVAIFFIEILSVMLQSLLIPKAIL